MASYVAKYRGATSTTAKVIDTDMLNFELIFDPPLKIIERETPVQSGGVLVRLGHSLARVKI